MAVRQRAVTLTLLLVLGLPVTAAAQTAEPGGSVAPAAASGASQPEGKVSAQTYRFAGTAWGASPTATKAELAKHGFSFDQADEDGDLIFTGTLNDRPAVVIALFSDDRLTKILLSVPTDEEATLPVYREMRSVLDGEYGTPGVEVESYAYPFADGKHIGYETTALRVGKATIGALWQEQGEALGIRISDRLIVSAHYESQAWRQEAERRTQRKPGA